MPEAARPNMEEDPSAALLQSVFRVFIASWPDSDSADRFSDSPAGSSAAPDAAALGSFSLATAGPPAHDITPIVRSLSYIRQAVVRWHALLISTRSALRTHSIAVGIYKN